MSNIKFVYFYRDGATYKSWDEVIFANPEQLTSGEIKDRVIANFLPDKLFIASQISIPEKFLFLDGKFTKYDHCYHEFDSIEVCEEKSTDSLGRSIKEFLLEVELAAKHGWEEFDILDRA